jgi:hypothetical protein
MLILGMHLTVELFNAPDSETKENTRDDHHHPERSQYPLEINLG